MNSVIERVKNLLSDLALAPKENRLHAVNLWEAFRRETRQASPATDDVIAAVDWMILNQEWRLGEPLLVMAAANKDPRLALRICSVIEVAHPTAPIENAIEFLADVALPETVPTLIRAVSFRFDFDPSLQIPIKALQALREIGDLHAMDYLRHISKTDAGLLATEASELLSDVRNDE